MKNRKTYHIAFVLLALLAIAFAQAKHEAAANRAWEVDPELGLIHRYGYVNCDYGYYVTFPPGVIGMSNLPPAPNHGFVVNLAAKDRATKVWSIIDTDYYIGVDNNYEVLDAKNVDEVVERELDYRREHNQKVTSNKAISLGGLSGRRLLIQYDSSGKKMVKDLTVTMREEHINYTVTMVTPADKYENNRPLLETILAGFHIIRIRNGQGECSNEWPPRYKAIQITDSRTH